MDLGRLAGDGLQGLNVRQLIEAGARIAQDAEILQPNAKHIAYLGELSETSEWPVPEYVREVDAVLPKLCKNPELELQASLGLQGPLS